MCSDECKSKLRTVTEELLTHFLTANMKVFPHTHVHKHKHRSFIPDSFLSLTSWSENYVVENLIFTKIYSVPCVIYRVKLFNWVVMPVILKKSTSFLLRQVRSFLPSRRPEASCSSSKAGSLLKIAESHALAKRVGILKILIFSICSC